MGNFWGAPDAVEDYADRAVSAAIRIQERIHALNKERAEGGHMQLYFGIGIATGEVLAGHVGTETRTDWTVIGSDVNLSQRISSRAWPYRIFISDKTHYALRKQVPVRKYEALALKGFIHQIQISAVLWYNGHSGPLLAENDPGGWHIWDGVAIQGPFSLEELLATAGFSALTQIARMSEDWMPFWRAAKGIKIWAIRSDEGPKGPFTLEEIFADPGAGPETLVRVQGDPEWRRLEEFGG